MSDEQLDLPLGDEPPPEDVQTETETPAEVPLTRVEQIAAVHGWRPNGKEDALAFLEKVPNYRENLVSKLASHEAEISKLYDALALKVKADHARELAVRERELREAARVGDEEAVARIARQMQEPAPAVAPRPQAPPDVPQVVQEWAERNAWIMQDQAKALQAQGLYEAELKARGGVDDPNTILPKVEAMMRKLHSQEAPRNPNRDLPSVTTPSGARPAAQARKAVFDNLNEMERRAVEQYREMGIPEEKIIASLKKLEGRHGR